MFGLERQSLAEHFRQREYQETGEEDRTAALAVREWNAIHCRQMQRFSFDGERRVTCGIIIGRMPEPALRERRQDRECEQRQADELNQEHGLAGKAFAAFDVAKEPAQQLEQCAEKDHMHQRHRQAIAHQHLDEPARLLDRDGDGVAQRRDGEIGVATDGAKHDRAGLAEDLHFFRAEVRADRQSRVDDHRNADAKGADDHQHDQDRKNPTKKLRQEAAERLHLDTPQDLLIYNTQLSIVSKEIYRKTVSRGNCIVFGAGSKPWYYRGETFKPCAECETSGSPLKVTRRFRACGWRRKIRALASYWRTAPAPAWRTPP